MGKKKHRLGVSETDLVKRHLKIDISEDADIDSAITEIDQLYGLDEVSYDEKKHVLHIAYDGKRVCLDCIDEALNKNGADISHDWWTHIKEEYYRFIDQNIKDNAQHEPWSCHKTPPHVRRKI